MTSDELDGEKSYVIVPTQAAECISLAISADPSAENEKDNRVAEQTTDIKYDTLETSGSDLDSVLKELASGTTIITTHSSTDALSPSGQILNSSDAIGTLNHHASFNASATGRVFTY